MVEDTDAIYGVYRERMLEAQKKHTAGAPGDHAGRMTNQTGTLWKSQGLPNRFRALCTDAVETADHSLI